MGARDCHRGAAGWILGVVLLSVGPAHAANDADPRVAYLDARAQVPVEYVLSRFMDHRVVLLGEHHWLRHDVELVLAVIPRLAERGVGALAVEMFPADDQALIDSIVTAPRWDPVRAMAILRRAQWPYRQYLEIIHAVWSVNRSRPPGEPLRLLGLGPGWDWRERLLPVGKTYDGFMSDIVKAYLEPAGRRALVYAGIHHAFTRYHQPELPRERKVERLMDRMGNMLWRDQGDDVFLITLHRPWQRRIGEKWGRDLPVGGAIDCAAAATGKPIGFDVAGSPFAALPIPPDYWYGMGYPELRLEDITDGYVWSCPIERYEGVELIPLSEFAPDPARLAEVSANNPFADEKGLGRPEIEALWKKENERLQDFPKASGWSGLYGWAERCRASRFGAAAADSVAGAPALPDSIGTLDLGTVARYFAEFDSVCARDGGALWGVPYAGPFLIADPASRSVAANRAHPGGVLVARGGVFVGTLPPEVPVANTAVDWLGRRWTMVMAGALSPNVRPRLRLMGHEAFHRLQPTLGLEAAGPLNEHLDTRDGRFWMQLEWNALQRALLATGAARRAAVADAQRFRAVRRELFPEARAREIALEIQEGLAEYAGARLLDYPDSLVVRMVAARREWDTAFVRSFAYMSGPLYGFLLDGASRDWRRGLTSTSDLGDLLRAALHLASPGRADVAVAAARRRAAGYGGDTLWTTETARDERRTMRLTEWRRTLIDGPALIVDLKKVHSGSFDPGAVFPMGGGRTVYGTRSLAADWGRLEVQDGAILEDPRAGEGRVALTGAAADRMGGRGWKLTLADGWQITPARRSGDFELTRR